MQPKHAEVLKGVGFSGSLDEFRAALVTVKGEAFGSCSIDELIFTRDEAAEFCGLGKQLVSLLLFQRKIEPIPIVPPSL
jgi:hypothetical protein